MNYTKQDIQRLVLALRPYLVKDSSFADVENISRPISIPVLQEGRNKLLDKEKFSEYTAKSIDLSKVPVVMAGATNLLAALDAIYAEALTKGKQGDTLSVKATGVTGTYIINGTKYYNVNDALLQIIGILAECTIATETQINDIFTN